MNMHTSYTLTHTQMDTDVQGHTQLYILQNTFMPTHISMCQHPHIPAYMHLCTHTRALKHTHLHSRTSTYTDMCTNAIAYTRA